MSTLMKAPNNDALTTTRILEAASDHVRRFGAAKTNVVDIAKVLGTSHTTIYRHFRSKAEVFEAIVIATIHDETKLARSYVEAPLPASERLEGLIVALHQRKLQRFKNDAELYQLYKRVVTERPDIIRNYTEVMTQLLSTILSDGVRNKEFYIDDVFAAANVVRDAVTVFINPAHVEASAKAGLLREDAMRRVISTLIVAFKQGVTFAPK
jgi:AcrR family transcriptional regulator